MPTPPTPLVTLHQATYPGDTSALLDLVGEYLTWLNVASCSHQARQELGQLEALFTPPAGLFVLAHVDGALAGCAGLLKHAGATAELKRVYVRPAHRGLAVGERLVRRLMALAPSLGAQHLILDAVPATTHAQGLYRRLGFTETAPYCAIPEPGTRFFELHLPPPQGHALPHTTPTGAPPITALAVSTTPSATPCTS